MPSSIKNAYLKLNTYYRLGLYSCLLTFVYRFNKKRGAYSQEASTRNSLVVENELRSFEKCSPLQLLYYFHEEVSPCFVKWHQDYISKKSIANNKHWSEIDFFKYNDIDIKNIWELSRFYWCPRLAYQLRKTNQLEFNQFLHSLFQSWLRENPHYYGPNWMCGQETAIRLLNIILAQELLPSNSKKLYDIDFLMQHCERIYLTTYYAKSQKNNHALSEAIGLFIGALYLQSHDCKDARVKKYLSRGRSLLEWCFSYLILDDGTFSQYSVNYHRLALDLLTICLMLCHQWGVLVRDSWLAKYDLMIRWLECFVDCDSGTAANIGSNDGAMLLNVNQTDYQNYHYSLVFAKKIRKKYSHDSKFSDLFAVFNEMNIPGLDQNQYIDTHRSYHFLSGGFVRLTQDDSWAIFRYPKFKFRPSQCDIMHFDLWVRGVNVLLDSGTYSYNTADEFQGYFKSVTAHNTVQIDGMEQMRSISRFLYLDWPKAKNIECETNEDGNITTFACSYKHYSGTIHRRKIELTESTWIITDTLYGLKNRADLYWHMPRIKGFLSDHTYQNELITLTIESNQPSFNIQLEECWISKYYQHKEKALVLTATCHANNKCQFITTIKVNS